MKLVSNLYSLYKMYSTLFLTESNPVGSLTVIRVNISTLRVEWTEPADFNGVFQTYAIQVSNERNSYNTTSTQLTVHQLGEYKF